LNILKDTKTQESRKCGFVIFDSVESKLKVLKCSSHTINKHKFNVENCIPKESISDSQKPPISGIGSPDCVSPLTAKPQSFFNPNPTLLDTLAVPKSPTKAVLSTEVSSKSGVEESCKENRLNSVEKAV
jgi:hypothetical protein